MYGVSVAGTARGIGVMAIRMRVSPDPDGIVRIRCGEAELELEIGPGGPPPDEPGDDPEGGGDGGRPGRGDGGVPRIVVLPGPLPWEGPSPFRQRALTTIGMSLGGSDIEKMVIEELKKLDPKEIENLDIVHLKTDVFDVHQLGDLALDMNKTYGGAAPKLFVDLQAPAGFMKFK
jgi:hypothetical protein